MNTLNTNTKKLDKNNLETLDKFTDYFFDLTQKFKASQSLDELRELNTMTVEMLNFLREEYQKESKENAELIIQKFQNGVALSSSDINTLENYIVGDATSYIKAFESSYQNNILSLFEFAEQIKEIDTNPQSPEYLIELTGKARTLQRITTNISLYLQEKKRIDDFRQALSDGIDQREAKFFASLLEFKLKSLDN